MAARITEVRDAVVTLIDWAWVPRDSADDEVLGITRVDIDSKSHRGRKVYVMRSAYSTTPATRAADRGDYSVVLMVVERHAGAGDPTEEWIDERVAWCEWLLEVVGDPRTVRLLAVAGDPASGLWPEAAEVTTVHDVEELADKKLFVSVLSVTYRENAEV